MAETKIETVTVEKIVRENQQRYVLTLDMNEARLLGTLRHFYVKGGTALHEMLYQLPCHPFDTVVSGMLMGTAKHLAESLRDALTKLESSQQEVARLSGALTASVASGGAQTLPLVGGSWHTTAEAEVTPVSKGWKVQYHQHSSVWVDVACDTVGKAGPAFVSSRNEAYRIMRGRSKYFSNPLSVYRVVPAEHAEGKDAPDTRGKYIVQLGIKDSGNMRWVRSTYVTDEYTSVADARIAITNLGARNSKYRVKWVP